MIEKLGSNAGTIYWMEMTFSPLICCINCIDVCAKRPKINEKRSGLAHLKKRFRRSVQVYCIISLSRQFRSALVYSFSKELSSKFAYLITCPFNKKFCHFMK